jgi:Rab5 GDP/GTP exchange factor
MFQCLHSVRTSQLGTHVWCRWVPFHLLKRWIIRHYPTLHKTSLRSACRCWSLLLGITISHRNVEVAIQTLPASRSQSPPLPLSSSSSISSSPVSLNSAAPGRPPAHPIPVPLAPPSQHSSLHAGEEPATPLTLPNIDARRFLQRTGDSLSKPLSAIGRIFSEALDGAEEALTSQFSPPETPAHLTSKSSAPDPPVPHTPYKPWVRRSSPSPSSARPPASHTLVDDTPSQRPLTQTQAQALAIPPNSHPTSRTGTPTAGLDIPGLQAEIDAAHSRAADAARGTLIQIFPAVDREVIEWVLEANEGDLGRSIEALLEIGGGN